MREARHDVVVTGVGAVSAFGVGAPALWSALRAGQSGIRPLRHPRAAEMRVGIAAQVPEDYDPARFFDERSLPLLDRSSQFALIAAREAALERAQASVVLAQKTYDRISQLAEHGNAPQARLDQATDTLHENQRAVDQAKSAYEQAVNGYTREERQIAEANVGKAIADIEAVQSIIEQMTVYAPVASQVYQRNAALPDPVAGCDTFGGGTVSGGA